MFSTVAETAVLAGNGSAAYHALEVYGYESFVLAFFFSLLMFPQDALWGHITDIVTMDVT